MSDKFWSSAILEISAGIPSAPHSIGLQLVTGHGLLMFKKSRSGQRARPHIQKYREITSERERERARARQRRIQAQTCAFLLQHVSKRDKWKEPERQSVSQLAKSPSGWVSKLSHVE